MEQEGSQAGHGPARRHSALLVAILAPSLAGIFMLLTEIVHLLIAAPFQAVTLAVLPLSTLAGAIRNLRAHFGDQVFLLQSRTRWMMAVAASTRHDRGAEHSVPADWGLAGGPAPRCCRRWRRPPSASRSGLRISACASVGHLVASHWRRCDGGTAADLPGGAQHCRAGGTYHGRRRGLFRGLACSTHQRWCGFSAHAPNIRRHERIQYDCGLRFPGILEGTRHRETSGFFSMMYRTATAVAAAVANGSFFFAASV